MTTFLRDIYFPISSLCELFNLRNLLLSYTLKKKQAYFSRTIQNFNKDFPKIQLIDFKI